ncbi:hypothetical protein T07_8170 [Trichinella nelsoni]|uniref:Uncharacterized protein n=1 Tax=Trichinella nelsoni TaxID=6336 RepID=A0A0V0RKQ8_9BILA|nr:hypothetical protein T07_8170 [Trichinella nelsoni]
MNPHIWQCPAIAPMVIHNVIKNSLRSLDFSEIMKVNRETEETIRIFCINIFTPFLYWSLEIKFLLRAHSNHHHLEGGIKSALELVTLKLRETAPTYVYRFHPYI